MGWWVLRTPGSMNHMGSKNPPPPRPHTHTHHTHTTHTHRAPARPPTIDPLTPTYESRVSPHVPWIPLPPPPHPKVL